MSFPSQWSKEDAVKRDRIVLDMHSQGKRLREIRERIAADFGRTIHGYQYYRILNDAGVSTKKRGPNAESGGKVLIPKTEDDVIGALTLRKLLPYVLRAMRDEKVHQLIMTDDGEAIMRESTQFTVAAK